MAFINKIKRKRGTLMKQLINDIYRAPMAPELRQHLLRDLGLSTEDQKIIKSLMDHDAESAFHYETTGVGRGKFERRLNSINRVIFPELVRLAGQQVKSQINN